MASDTTTRRLVQFEFGTEADASLESMLAYVREQTGDQEFKDTDLMRSALSVFESLIELHKLDNRGYIETQVYPGKGLSKFMKVLSGLSAGGVIKLSDLLFPQSED